MPGRQSLAVYVLHVKGRRTNDLLPVADFGRGDLLDLMREWLVSLEKEPDDNEVEQRVMTLKRLDRTGRTLTGIIELGLYGSKRDIYDCVTRQKVGAVETHHAVLGEYFFRVDVPEDDDKGLLFLHRQGQHGITADFDQGFKTFFRTRCSDFTLVISPLAPAEVVKHYLNPQRVTKLRFIAHRVPPNFVSRLDGGLHEFEGDIEIVLKARRNASIPFRENFQVAVKEPEMARRMVTIPGIQPEEVDVKVELVTGHGQRTVTVTNLSNIRAAWDITGRVLPSANGNLPYEAFLNAANWVAEEVGARLRMVVEDVQQDQSEEDLD